ncbi:arabinan endo-1,5-alpha-L-arabinosidase [Fontisphaera persica]|uniref:arabinan endo-1,5-alpha-L-arabinosidase n=1 Tax=Fontisphaera persica TaxID=2974023 RepID=UPI0024BF6E41|nr:arabinan endo-1,5-alpha-L-arabinosidase [Fontisphaera persica]WCJ59356.1 arabinan endo-1,5-alpha-L-arabinosidase [Fontisphaera persica]
MQRWFCTLLLGWLIAGASSLRAAAGPQWAPGPEPPAHDPSSLVPCGPQYWFFATGVGIRSWHSTNLIAWQEGPRVWPQMPAWVTNIVPAHRGHFWAPDVIAISNRFLLYYSISSWGRNRSAIALATNPTLDPQDPRFHWKDAGVVIESFPTNDFNAIDPAVTRDTEGRLWLSFGSFWSGIKLVELDPATGKRRAPNSPLHSLARAPEIEAPFIYRRGDFYYLFVNWNLCCRGTNSTYNLRIGRSPRITGPYRDRQGVDMNQGGGTLLLESRAHVIGPGHAGIISVGGKEWLSFHFYDARRRGTATLALRRLEWDPDGWPLVTDETPAGKPPAQ